MAKTTKPAEAERWLGIELLIDKSGSMGGNRGRVVKGVNELLDFLRTMSNPPVISVTAYDYARYVMLAPEPAYNVPHLTRAEYDPGGGTNTYGSMAKALEVLAAMKVRHRALIVITDGDCGSGIPHSATKDKIAKAKADSNTDVVLLCTGQIKSKKLGPKIGIPEGFCLDFPEDKFTEVMRAAAEVVIRSACGDAEGFTEGERKLKGGKK